MCNAISLLLHNIYVCLQFELHGFFSNYLYSVNAIIYHMRITQCFRDNRPIRGLFEESNFKIKIHHKQQWPWYFLLNWLLMPFSCFIVIYLIILNFLFCWNFSGYTLHNIQVYTFVQKLISQNTTTFESLIFIKTRNFRRLFIGKTLVKMINERIKK